MGRKSKLTPELQEKFCKAAKTSVTLKVCCAYVGIDETTFYNWMKKSDEAAEAVEAGDEGAEKDKYFQFMQSVSRARAAAQVELAECLLDAAPSDWRAAEAVLKRRYSIDWEPARQLDIQADIRTTAVFIAPEPAVTEADWVDKVKDGAYNKKLKELKEGGE